MNALTIIATLSFTMLLGALLLALVQADGLMAIVLVLAHALRRAHWEQGGFVRPAHSRDDFATSLMRAAHTNTPGRAHLWDKIKHNVALALRGGPEQGGYVHDTATSFFMTPNMAFHTIGTWTDTVGNVALTYMKRRTGAAATNQLVYPIAIPQNTVAFKGSLLKSIDVWYELATAAMTTLTPVLDLATLPPTSAATGTVFGAPTVPAITFDASHNTNALRAAIGKHHMTITVTTPLWLGPNDLYYLDITIVDPGTAVYDDYGIRVNYTFRI
jgi:hypothetical protein